MYEEKITRRESLQRIGASALVPVALPAATQAATGASGSAPAAGAVSREDVERMEGYSRQVEQDVRARSHLVAAQLSRNMWRERHASPFLSCCLREMEVRGFMEMCAAVRLLSTGNLLLVPSHHSTDIRFSMRSPLETSMTFRDEQGRLVLDDPSFPRYVYLPGMATVVCRQALTPDEVLHIHVADPDMPGRPCWASFDNACAALSYDALIDTCRNGLEAFRKVREQLHAGKIGLSSIDRIVIPA